MPVFQPNNTETYQKLVPRIKRLWLEALRSGEYTQCFQRMRVTKRSLPETRENNGEGHCCLGVLVEVAVKEHAIDKFAINNRSQGATMLVRDWARLNPEAQSKLMKMNDGTPSGQAYSKPKDHINRKNFAEIAEWIEANL